MSDLSPDAVREALASHDRLEAMVAERYPGYQPAEPAIVEAARLWLASRSAPTDQEVERAARAIQRDWSGLRDGEKLPIPELYTRLARAALLAAGQEGNDE